MPALMRCCYSRLAVLVAWQTDRPRVPLVRLGWAGQLPPTVLWQHRSPLHIPSILHSIVEYKELIMACLSCSHSASPILPVSSYLHLALAPSVKPVSRLRALSHPCPFSYSTLPLLHIVVVVFLSLFSIP